MKLYKRECFVADLAMLRSYNFPADEAINRFFRLHHRSTFTPIHCRLFDMIGSVKIAFLGRSPILTTRPPRANRISPFMICGLCFFLSLSLLIHGRVNDEKLSGGCFFFLGMLSLVYRMLAISFGVLNVEI